MSTGWLAVTGVLLVLLASAYAGISDSSIEAGDGATQEARPTPKSEAVEAATESPTPEPEPTATPVTNRENCDQIRGTAYFSPEERTWYLANCVRR